MKTLTKVGVALSALLSLGACSQPANEAPQDYYMFTSFHEPANEGLRFLYSADGIHWDSVPGTWLKPELGDSILRDPSIIVGKDSTFHLVWTLSWRGNTGFGYARSKDLVHWSDQRRIPAMDSVPSTVNVWAPEWFYDDVNDCYMVIYSSCVPERKFDLGVEEENNNHRLYYVTTRDFTEFSSPRLLYDAGYSCIDGFIVKRGDGDYVLVAKDNRKANSNLRVAFARNAEGPYTNPLSRPFTGIFAEGPSVSRHIYGASTTRDFIHFTDVTDQVSFPQEHKHGTTFRAPASIVEGLLRAAQQHGD